MLSDADQAKLAELREYVTHPKTGGGQWEKLRQGYPLGTVRYLLDLVGQLNEQNDRWAGLVNKWLEDNDAE